MYHKVDPRWEWGGTRITPKKFEQQLAYLKARDYCTLSLPDYLNKCHSGKIGRNYVVLSFDDSYESIYHYAFPLLKKYDFTATVFVITDFIGRENTWDANLGGRTFKHLSAYQILEMSNHGIQFGSHTASHPCLTLLSREVIQKELKDSKHILESLLNRTVDFISYPFGRTDTRVIKTARRIGYKGGVIFKSPKKRSIPPEFRIERQGVYLLDNLTLFKAKLGENTLNHIEQKRLKLINFFSLGTVIVQGLKK